MIAIDPRAAEKLQPELLPGESIYWAGMPNPHIVFHSDDFYMIPFSLLWGGFAIFWEAGVLGYVGDSTRSHKAPLDFVLWGIPFILIGQYMIWGRFVYDACLKRRTYYGITNRRVLILQNGWKRKTQFLFLEAIPLISREGAATGTLWLGAKSPAFANRSVGRQAISRLDVGGAVPALIDIDDTDQVYRLIVDLRDKVRKASASSGEAPPT
ncbi:MAG TPA: PH domain-containing protein [Methylomirabilota bacterium]|nr:PH domain-containing protein [Methylomirabilota bacterium]